MICSECGSPITEKVTATAGDHVAAEIEYHCPVHGIQGFWAYGYWHPGYPIYE